MISRMLKINSLMRRELSQIIGFELSSPNIGFVTVMAIEVSKDLRHAKAFISVMGNEKQKQQSIQGIIKQRSFIQKELGNRLSLKFIPVLQFIMDDTVDHSMHIDEVLRKIHKESSDTGGGENV